MKISEKDLINGLKEKNRRNKERAEGCPSPSDLVAVSLNEAPGVDRKMLIEHLSTCSDCAMEYSALSDVGKWAKDTAGEILIIDSKSRPDGKTVLEKLARMFGTIPGLAAVSAGILLVGAFSFWIFTSVGDVTVETTRDRPRGTSAKAIETEPNNAAELSAPPQKLSWKTKKAASYYRVVIYDFESTKIWESEKTKTNEVDIPPEIISKFKPGSVYYWRIFSYNGITNQSDLLRFKISDQAR